MFVYLNARPRRVKRWQCLYGLPSVITHNDNNRAIGSLGIRSRGSDALTLCRRVAQGPRSPRMCCSGFTHKYAESYYVERFTVTRCSETLVNITHNVSLPLISKYNFEISYRYGIREDLGPWCGRYATLCYDRATAWGVSILSP